MEEELIPGPLVELRRVAKILSEVLAHPERYQIQQSEADMGTATMPSPGKSQNYNRISCNVVFVEKPLNASGEGVDV
jgi:hypothetical protein